MQITIERNELDNHFVFDLFVGFIFLVMSVVCFFGGLLWDAVAGHFFWVHSAGLGVGQILWIGFSSLAILIAWFYLVQVFNYMKYYGR